MGIKRIRQNLERSLRTLEAYHNIHRLAIIKTDGTIYWPKSDEFALEGECLIDTYDSPCWSARKLENTLARKAT